VIPAIISLIVLSGIIVLLLRENRRLTNLLLSKNPSVTIATETRQRSKTKSKETESPNIRAAWHNPTEAVGP
jgi:hypothetical protein